MSYMSVRPSVRSSAGLFAIFVFLLISGVGVQRRDAFIRWTKSRDQLLGFTNPSLIFIFTPNDEECISDHNTTITTMEG